MEIKINLVNFRIGELRFAISLSNVKRVIQVVEITFLPEAPDFISGIINLEGIIIPVADIRKRINLPAKEIQLSDQIIIVQTPNRIVGLLVDSTDDVASINNNYIINSEEIIPALEHINGIVNISGNIIYITDIDKFLSLDEEIMLDKALKKLEK